MAMTLRLTAEIEARLEELTSKLGISKNKFIEAAIVEKLNRDGKSLIAEKIIDKVLSRDAEALGKL
jgi:predicted transcriptional regulator